MCRASGEHTSCNPPQTVTRLFDGSLATKWLDFGAAETQASAWVEYRLLPSQEAVAVTHYSLIAGEDCPERDPCDWVLEAASGGAAKEGSSSSSSVSWVVLHECQGHKFARRHQLCSFTVPPAARISSRAWRLRITRTADPSTATCVQLACWNLYTTSRSQEQLLYLDSSMCSQLQQQAAAKGDGDVTLKEGLDTLRRILTNMQKTSSPPPDPKFFKLSVKAAKLQSLLAQPLLQAAVFAAGFRPVLMAEGGGEVLSLVADDSSSGEVQAAVSMLLKMLVAGGAGGGGGGGGGGGVV